MHEMNIKVGLLSYIDIFAKFLCGFFGFFDKSRTEMRHWNIQ
jgi:hypothetical protein